MEAASTLADTLLDDLDDLSDVEETSPQDRFDQDADGDDGDDDTNESHKAGDMEKAALLLQRQEGEDNDAYDTRIASSVPPKKRLLDDKYLIRHLNTIRSMDSAESKTSGNATKEQQEDEHQLIVQSNKHLSNLADELAQAHRDLCATYKAKFPELEELLPNPVQYKNAVRVIGNEMDMTKSNDALMEFLNNNQIITISVAGSTTSGRLLTTRELEQVDDAATYIEDIIKIQNELAEFVEQRMESLAPSICALVGAPTAARLIGLAGGLAELTKIPACNLQVLGQVKQNAASRAGLSSISTSRHQGVLMDCDLVKQCPKHLQKKALKTVAAKLALSLRCDFVNVDTGRTRSAQTGRKFRDDIEAKFHKWLEPDKAQTLKSLPK
jgi:U4/U6 small nuclear ribonucleoprotein PRP31